MVKLEEMVDFSKRWWCSCGWLELQVEVEVVVARAGDCGMGSTTMCVVAV